LLLGFLVRLLLINADGFRNDVSTFESWSLTLAQHPLRDFFAKAGFADYPPGYFFVLWIVGHLYKLLIPSDPTYGILKIFVKMPGILMDLVDAGLIFVIVRRFASVAWAFAAAAFFTFNPATIFISAYWGQVDSVAGGITLLSLLLMIDSEKRTGRAASLSIVGAWLLLAYSILIKPPAVVLVPLYFAYIFASDDSAVRVRRAIATWGGVIGGLLLAYLAAFCFVPNANPIALASWLVGRYAYASGVYAYNSVNAFNLYVMGPGTGFWRPDNIPIPNIGGAGLPEYVWGIGLVVAATVLVISRFVQRRDAAALLEAAMILSLGYFVLSTRMHERYIFNAVLLATPLIFYRKRYLYAAIALSITLLANLFYSLDYLYVMDARITGVDPTDLMPLISRPAALLNVVTFFYLGYVYLGSGEDALEGFGLGAAIGRLGTQVREWFSPVEGTAWMTLRDWQIAGFLTVSSFVLTFVDYAWPSEKIFDEIYYARAGEEYLAHKDIFEFTHPPLTKLWITLSMILFGGLHGAGDTSTGWRFLNLVMGALMVLVLYCFAKRLLGSTAFATVAASLLLLDGFHYVQSRIATPEITVAFFSLLTLYAFYRFWLASQVRVAPYFSSATLGPQAVVLAGGVVVAVIFSWLVSRGQGFTANAAAFLYVMCGFYLVARLAVPRYRGSPTSTSYGEGSRIHDATLHTLDGGRVPLGNGAILAGDTTKVEKNALVFTAEGVRVEYARTGHARYATNGGGEAAFAPDGTVRTGAAKIDGNRDGMIWLWVLALCSGALAASKWNGLFDFFVIWGIALGVVVQGVWAPLQRAVGRTSVIAVPATWGNPFGFSFDIVVAAMLFVSATIYTLCYIPYFTLGHNLSDLIGLQQQMFGYHYDLKATHPYGSKWWQWPLIGRPISYYYHDWRVGAATQDPAACCVAEIIALPNPAVWWLGLVSVPMIGWLGWRERNKGYLLLVTAYLLQWLPWMTSPRVAFEYHFFPNLAIICLADTVLLQRAWQYGKKLSGGFPILGMTLTWPQLAAGAYLALVVSLFVFFYPVLAGLHVPWHVWDARMWHWIMGNAWI
jgi:dolichyl-phosphate-mannose--protein O-mannosyl transferase/Gpi18-like mannosyltransferase